MATHSSTLAWKIPWTEEPGRLQSMGLLRVRHDWSDLATAAVAAAYSLCMDVRVGLWRKLSAEEVMLLNCGVGEDSWESLGLQGDPTSPSYRKSVLGVHWKDWCWNWNSNTLAIWCQELTHWKRPWCWEGLGAGGEGDDRGWDGWMASPTQWTWVWVDSGNWWWTGRPGMLKFMGLQRVRHEWAAELNWKLYDDSTFL